MPTARSSPAARSSARFCIDLSPGDIDTAVFTGVVANYTVTTDANGVTTVTDNVGTDGTDTLYNIERLQFADVTTGGTNNVPTGTVAVIWTAQVGQVLTADPAAIVDADGIASPFSYQWQYQIIAAPGGTAQWVNIVGATAATFAPTDFYVGNPLRVVASFTDGQGFTETVFSAPTALLAFDPAVNHAPTVVTQVAEPGLFDTTALQDQPITLSLPLVTTFTDDQTAAANLIYTATLADGTALETIGLSLRHHAGRRRRRHGRRHHRHPARWLLRHDRHPRHGSRCTRTGRHRYLHHQCAADRRHFDRRGRPGHSCDAGAHRRSVQPHRPRVRPAADPDG